MADYRLTEPAERDLLLFWPVWQYLIVYRADSNPLEIVRIVHGRRDVQGELEPE
jgi:plasmid stabilization system protein ParE